MNFIIFSAQYLPTVGGVERYTNSLAQALIKKGHSITVVTSQIKNTPSREQSPEGIQIYRIPVKWMMNNRFPIPLLGKKFFDISKEISENHYDMAIIQTRFYPQSGWAAHICRKSNIPAVVIEHGTAYLIRDGILGILGKVYEHIWAKYVYSNCKNFYGVSKACCNWLGNFGINAKGCMYNSVDPQQLNSKADSVTQDKIPFKENITICFTGRFIKEKGVVNLAKAFEKLNAKYPNTLLVMAGDGELFNQVKSMGIKNLILTGNVSYEESLSIIKNSDIFCLPTFSEGFSTAVLEAAALKTAIVTTATGGSTELIETENEGYILNSMQTEDIYNTLCKAVENIDFTHSCADKAYIKLKEKFTWEKAADNFLKICEDKG